MSSFGNTTTTTGTNTGTTSSMQQATPQDMAFMNSLYPQMSNLLAQSQKPVYGQAQEAQMLNATNQATNSGIQGLASAMASRGGNLNSGAFGKGAAEMLGQRSGIMSNYAMQTPLLNQQAQFGQGLQAMGMANQLAGPALRGQTGSTAGSSSQTTEQNSGWGNMLMSGLGAVAGGLTGGMTGGLSGLAGSLFKSSPSLASMNAMPAGQGYGGLNYGPTMGQLTGGGIGVGNSMPPDW